MYDPHIGCVVKSPTWDVNGTEMYKHRKQKMDWKKNVNSTIVTSKIAMWCIDLPISNMVILHEPRSTCAKAPLSPAMDFRWEQHPPRWPELQLSPVEFDPWDPKKTCLRIMRI